MEPYSFWLMLKGAPLANSCFGGSHSLDKPYRCVSKNSSERPSESITFNSKTQGLGRATILITCMGLLNASSCFPLGWLFRHHKTFSQTASLARKRIVWGHPSLLRPLWVYVSPWRFPYNLMIFNPTRQWLSWPKCGFPVRADPTDDPIDDPLMML